MVLKPNVRNLSNANDRMSFFDPVYSNDHIEIEDENDLLAEGIPRVSFEIINGNESHAKSDTDIVLNQSSDFISPAKLRIRIDQIENSMEQAQRMLNSMEEFQHLVPGTDNQRNKLQSILCNLEEQKASYMNLLKLVSLAEQERSAILNGNTTDNTDENDHDDDDLSLRRQSQLPIVRPRIESKIGFINSISILPSEMHFSDTEPTIRNENYNYDTLVGSLKTDTLTWTDQQSITDDELSDDELEKALMSQKEQFRALQGQKRALLALKERSEKRLLEQQQLTTKNSTSLKQSNDEMNLLLNINHLRDRLKLIRNIYEEKHRDELENLQHSSIPTENRLKNLEHVRERLDELEQLVTYYQTNDEFNLYETNENSPKHLDKLSTELATKRLELEQAKSALNQLQKMVKSIQPEESSSSVQSTPIRNKSSLNHSMDTPRSVDAKMVAQHREIERLVESRQRLHTIQDQITSLYQTMKTPITETNDDLKGYEDKLNNSRNLRPNYQSNQEENINEFNVQNPDQILIKPRMKQSNCYASDTIVGKSSDDLNNQMRKICHCLSTFIEEQKLFNRHIEQHLITVGNSTNSQSTDPLLNQLQQQVVTQGLVVNLNSAYREIAVLQSKINSLQSENNRLISSVSFDQQHNNDMPHSLSRESIYSFNRFQSNHVQPLLRSTFNEQHNHIVENSSRSSIDSQSTGKQTAIHVDKHHLKTTSIQQKSHQRQLSKENLFTSFVIHRRSTSNENKHISNEIYSTSTTQNLSQIEIQTIDLQIKSIMVQLIPYMRLHMNEGFNQYNLNHLRQRILFLFKQQPDSARLINRFQNQFSQLLDKIIGKYSGTNIHDCAADLIQDISDATFNELIKYKLNENEN